MSSRLNPQNLIFKDGSSVPLVILNSTLNKLSLTGDTGSNDVLLSGILAPVSNNDAVNKGYTNAAFVRIDGTSTMTGGLNLGSFGISNAGQIVSTIATGTAPLSVASTTLVPNLYVARAAVADSATSTNLTGVITSVGNATSTGAQTGTGNTFVMNTSPTLITPVIGAATGTSLSVSGQLTSTVAIGTAPLSITSTTLVPNLYTSRSVLADTVTATVDATNASRFLTFVNSSTTGAQGMEMATGITVNPSVNSISVTGQLSSTIVTGTAPLTVSSTTLVPNLYVARSVLSDTVTTNANLTGPITSAGNATSVAAQTGTGSTFVMNTSPTLITPALGAATATSINSTTFINAFDICNGRLTLTSGVPVTTTDVTSATTLYWTPYKGSYVAIYNGTQWLTYQFSELSISIIALAAGMYDVFVSISGSPTLSLLAWTNTTTRATALTQQNGVYVLSGTTTKRYLGTIYISTPGSTADAALTNGASTSAGRYVWNYYNRVRKSMNAPIALGTSWSYSSNTIRVANGTIANQLNFVVGVVEDVISANIVVGVQYSANSSQYGIGFGMNATTTFNTNATSGAASYATVTGANNTAITAVIEDYSAIGLNYLAYLECTNNTSVSAGSIIVGTGNFGLVGLRGNIMC